MEQYQLVLPGDVDSTPGASVIANSSFLGDTKYTLGIRGLGWKSSISSFLRPPPRNDDYPLRSNSKRSPRF